MADNNITPPEIQIPSDANFYRAQKKLVIILDSAENKENVRFDNGVDIKKNIKIELADYVSNQTVIAQNAFPVAPSNNDAGSITLSDSENNPAQLIEPSRNGQRVYIDSIAPNAKAAFNETSTTKQLNTDIDGPFQIKKGKLSSNAPTGDDIYRSIDTQKENAPFVKRVQRVLIDNTHYNAEQPFIPNPGNTNENDIKLATVSYNTLGLYGPKKYPNPTTDITENNRINIREMKRLGLLTLLAGAGDVTPSLPADKTNDAWFNEVAAATSLIPGLGRLGVKFPTSRFDSNQVVKTMKPDFIRPTNTQFLDGKTTYTYGNGNTPFAPFAGDSAISSIASATILVATVGGLLFAFTQLNFQNQNSEIRSKTTIEERYSFLGSSDGVSNANIWDTPKLKNDFFACLNEGIKAFFGFEVTPGTPVTTLNQLGNSTEKITKAHGYFNVILKQIVRGTSDLLGGFGASVGIGQGSSFEPKADQIFDQVNPLAVIERLKTQPIVKFINILVTIGDRMIARHGSLKSNAEDTVSIIDLIIEETIETDRNSPINPAILIAKDKLNLFSNRSTMAARNMRSLLAIPTGLDLASSRLGRNNSDSANPGEAITAIRINNQMVNSNDSVFENRFDSDTVKAFEDYLEKDYMPFYFQDIRTNEILSFHAFVGDLNESLNADYTETEGYGRIGSVPIYKNTKRNLGFSFYVVSTSPEDFDEMWYKINRLATMLFPQWSEGRRIDFGQNKLVQPFSQVPAASPLIRFRIGDLWKANYSKFAVARLFGLSHNINEFKISDMREVQSSINYERIEQQVANIMSRRNAGNYETGEKIKINVEALNGQDSHRIYRESFGTPTNPNQRQARRNANNFGEQIGNQTTSSPFRNVDRTEWLEPTQNTELTIQRVVNDGNNRYVVATVNLDATYGAVYSHLASNGRNQRRQRSTPSDQTFVIPINLINNDVRLIRAQAQALVIRESPPPTNPNEQQNDQRNNELTQQFFADNGNNANPIMKAFKSTEGRGIAGFIRTMSFDYSQSTWDTDKFGGRAPKFLKIQIEFIPVWDVYPGLDYKGAMTAPIWNVGNIINNYHGGRGLDNAAKNSFTNAKKPIPKL